MTFFRGYLVVGFLWLLSSMAIGQEGVTVIADSILLDKTYGATVRIDLGSLTSEDLKTISVLDPYGRDVLPPRGSDLTVSLIVPKSLAAAEGKQLADLLEPVLRERFGRETLEIKLIAIDVTQAAIVAQSANNNLVQVAAEMPGAEAKEISKIMVAANQKLVQSLRDWQEAFPRQIEILRRDPRQIDLFFASVIGVTSSIAPVWLWLSTTGLNVMGLSQAFLSIIYDQINTRFSTRLIKFEAEHEIPVLKRTPLVKFYNENALVKAMAVNFGINAFAGLSFRSLSWLNDPGHVASPASLDFVSTLAGLNLVSGAFTAGSDIGVAKLRRKGYISTRTEILINSVFSLLAQINNVILGSGMTEWLPLGVAIEWTGKGAAAILGQALPARGNRFVMIHPDFGSSESVVRYLHGLEEALTSKQLTLADLRDMVQRVDPSNPNVLKPTTLQKLRQAVQTVQTRTFELYVRACQYFKEWRN